MNRPLLLLLGTDATLGLNLPLGKLAIAAGVEPALWAALISLGARLGAIDRIDHGHNCGGGLGPDRPLLH